MTSKFDKIRSYSDADLSIVLKSLSNNQAFINALVKFQFGKWPPFTHSTLAFILKPFIKKKMANISRLHDFQMLIKPHFHRMLRNSTSALTVSGLDELDVSKPCLFVSNHRDIALDPAFVNWALHINGQDTVRIAVGDNLLKEKWIADLIRLNKCFVVQRTVEGRREKLAAAKLLSEYIAHSLLVDKQHLWIAQREGRAKDGIDTTNPAIISMLTLHKPKTMEFSEYVNQLRIVPVSISYEFDPCDVSKAKELSQAETEAGYKKPDNEDMRSIVRGITGQKGKVHLHFGHLADKTFLNTNELAQYISAQILDGFRIFPTATVALDMLNAKQTNDELYTPSASNEYDTREQAAYAYLRSKLLQLNADEQHKLLSMYANPLLRKENAMSNKAT